LTPISEREKAAVGLPRPLASHAACAQETLTNFGGAPSRVLLAFTAREAFDLAQHERRLKRGSGHIRTEADLVATAALEA
jgi:hypothetical protein